MKTLPDVALLLNTVIFRAFALALVACGTAFGLREFHEHLPTLAIVACNCLVVVFSWLAVTKAGGRGLSWLFFGFLALVAVPSWSDAANNDLISYQATTVAALCCVLALVGRIKFLPYAILAGALLLFGLVEDVIGSYRFMTGHDISQPQILAISDTNFEEATGYLRTNPTVLPFLLFLIVMSCGLFIASGKALSRRLDIMEYAALWMVFCVLAMVATSTDTYKYDRAETFAMVRDSYTREALYQRVADERKQNISQVGAHKNSDFKPAVYVVVVGESANRNHLRLYGYPRDTTPLLDKRKDEMVVFNNAISSYCSTILSLRRALTLASVDSKKEYYDDGMYSVIEVLRGAGFKTYWISNQAKWGVWGVGTSIIASGADYVFFQQEKTSVDASDMPTGATALSTNIPILINGQVKVVTQLDWYGNYAGYDGALLDRIDETIDDASEPTVIFVHIMGSHAPYKNRYPKEFEKFPPDADKEEFRDASNVEKVNAYDNSVIYTDFILDRIIEKLARKTMPTSLLYFSDHGESVDLGKQHDPSEFTPGHVEVPLVMWFSPAYREAYGETVRQAAAHADSPFMMDSLTQTVIDWTHIGGPFAKPERSLLNSRYSPSPRLTLDGTVDYDNLLDSYCAITKAATGIGVGGGC